MVLAMKGTLTGAALVVALSSAAFGQVVVYDNTTTYLNNNMPLLPEWLNDSAEAGDEIWLGGTAREVVQLKLLFFYRGTLPGTFDARIRFREIDELTSSPGNAFYDSGIISAVPTVAGMN